MGSSWRVTLNGQRQVWMPGGDLFDVQILKRRLPIGNLTSQFFANVYLNPLDHFVKHEQRVQGYVRYMDDFLLFGDDRAVLRRQGEEVRRKLAELRLRIHPDKYRLVPTASGVDFVGYVVFADGRIRVRSSSVRRFDRRYKRLLWDLRHRQTPAARVTQSVRAWGAHVQHAQSYGLRRSVLTGRRKGRKEGRKEDVHFSHQPDHVIAQKHRGPTHEDNLAWACYLCNLLKGSDIASVDMETGQIVRLFNPRLDHWPEHFRLQDGQIVPLTPVGRVTEYLLQFNQPQSVKERRWLIEAGRYSGAPPAGTERGSPTDRSGRSDMTGGSESVAGHPGG